MGPYFLFFLSENGGECVCFVSKMQTKKKQKKLRIFAIKMRKSKNKAWMDEIKLSNIKFNTHMHT